MMQIGVMQFIHSLQYDFSTESEAVAIHGKNINIMNISSRLDKLYIVYVKYIFQFSSVHDKAYDSLQHVL